MKKISLIIVTYNSQNIIEKCLENLFRFNDIDESLEVIIVDNSNDEISSQMFTMLGKKFPNKLILVKNKKNGGYGQGNNVGIKNASAPLIAIMNPDIILLEPLFKTVLNHFERESNLGILGFKQYGGANLSFYFRLEFCFPFLISYLTKVLNKINFFTQKYMFLSGAFFFMSKKEFENLGLFDENIFLYAEESDITNRFLRKKMILTYDDKKSYLHEIDKREEMSTNGYKIFIESALYYLEKFSFKKSSFLRCLNYELVMKKIIYTILKNKKIEIINKQLEIIKKYS